MNEFGYILGQGVRAGAGAIGGGSVLDAAGTLGGGGSSFQELLNLQSRVQAESLQVNLQSNVIKARHEARMSAVRNLRS